MREIVRAVWDLDEGVLSRSIEEQASGYDPKSLDLRRWSPDLYVAPHVLRYAILGLAQVSRLPRGADELRGDEDASVLRSLRQELEAWFQRNAHCLQLERVSGRLARKAFCRPRLEASLQSF